MKVKRRSTRRRVTASEVRRKAPLSGPHYLNTPEWRTWVETKLKEKGLNNNKLAKIIGVTRTTIGNLLKATGTKQSRHVPAINKALGGVPPIQTMPADAPTDELLVRLVEGWAKLDGRSKALVSEMVAELTKRSDNS